MFADFDRIAVGDVRTLKKPITSEDVRRFVELTGDDNPLHVDAAFAETTPFKSVVVHGMLGASFISTVIGTKLPGPGALWVSQNMEFLRPVRLGDELLISCTVLKKHERDRLLELKTVITNQDGQEVLAGTAKVKVLAPKPSESPAPQADRPKVALVSGASGGIGAAVVRRLAADGHRVVVSYRGRRERAEALVEEVRSGGGSALAVQADVADPRQAAAMVDAAMHAFGAVSVLVNAAAPAISPKSLANADWADLQKHLDVQVRGAFELAKACARQMGERRHGRIVNITSQVVDGQPTVNWTAYAVAKAALAALSRQLAAELGPVGVTVNCVSPRHDRDSPDRRHPREGADDGRAADPVAPPVHAGGRGGGRGVAGLGRGRVRHRAHAGRERRADDVMSALDLNAHRAVLADPGASFFQVQKSVTALEKADDTLKPMRLGLSSNVQVDRLALYLRRHALLAGVRLQVTVGGYDTLTDDLTAFGEAGVDLVVVLPFFDNLLPAFEAQVSAGLDAEVLSAKRDELAQRYRLAFLAAKATPTVLVGDFHRAWPAAALRGRDRVSEVLDDFRGMLAEAASDAVNVTLLDLQPVVAVVGEAAMLDRRFYAQAKAPYGVAMLDELGRRVSAATRGFGTRFHKVLALDCDNTLWGGVLGEDLVEGVALSPYEYPGNVYWRAQQEFAGLERSGVLLCLCTKNNPADVEEMLETHPHMVLRSDRLAVKKVNWDDKSGNLRAIAEELNLGLDSMVFLDDSPFELEGVRSQVPAVKTFQVPSTLTDYPAVVAEIKALFLAGGVSRESTAKTQQYKQKAAAESARAQFSSQEEYLASLELKVVLARDVAEGVARVSELSQKSNQFNLTTRRYTAAEISDAMERPDSSVYALSVSDKFGPAGLTGVAVVRYGDGVADVEAFLMSCRVIGRGVEFAIWPSLARDAVARGCSQVRARYVRTPKNKLVETFYDRLGLTVADENGTVTSYQIAAESLLGQKSPWIEVVDV